MISGIAFVVGVFLYYVAAPWNLIGRTDPVGGEAGYRAGRRARAEPVEKNRRDLDRHHGLSHLCDAALALQRPRARHPDQRARPLPGFCAIPAWTGSEDHTGLYVAREPDNRLPLWNETNAVRKPLERVERSWRGVVMDTYALEKLTGWTPELSPPPDPPRTGAY